MFLSQAREVPHPDGLIQGTRHDQVLRRMELGAHDVVVVACQTANLGTVLPVPDSDGLVIRRGKNPREVVVEEHGSDEVQVSGQSEEALTGVQGPDLDGVVVTTRDEDWLSRVEVDATDRSLVALETVKQGAHSVVPQLDRG